jgi:hypothetical protein
MPGFLMHLAVGISCTHAAPAANVPTQARVLVSGQAVATMSDKFTVTGCPFQIPIGTGTKPQPCVTIQWAMPSTRVLIGGKPAMLQPAPGAGSGVCQSVEQIPQGPPQIKQIQTRVTGM